MPLPTVTAGDFKARYPSFDSVDDGVVDAFLEEARGAVDDTWILADQKPALMAYAAHLMTLEGVGSEQQSIDLGGGSVDVTGALESVQVGDVRVKFGSDEGSTSSSSSGGATGELRRTAYGRRYYELLRRSNPAVLVA